MKDFLRSFRTLCLLSLVLVVGAESQTTNGNIQGTVVDAQGASVAGATVTARNMDTGLSVRATPASLVYLRCPTFLPAVMQSPWKPRA